MHKIRKLKILLNFWNVRHHLEPNAIARNSNHTDYFRNARPEFLGSHAHRLFSIRNLELETSWGSFKIRRRFCPISRSHRFRGYNLADISAQTRRKEKPKPMKRLQLMQPNTMTSVNNQRSRMLSRIRNRRSHQSCHVNCNIFDLEELIVSRLFQIPGSHANLWGEQQSGEILIRSPRRGPTTTTVSQTQEFWEKQPWKLKFRKSFGHKWC